MAMRRLCEWDYHPRGCGEKDGEMPSCALPLQIDDAEERPGPS
jgi:hypothetical protein